MEPSGPIVEPDHRPGYVDVTISEFPMTIHDILQAALALPEEERAQLGHRLLESVFGPPPQAATTDEEWAEEIERRVREIRDGAELLDGRQVLADARKRLAARKS